MTRVSLPKYFSMVLALAGDSTMTSCIEVLEILTRVRTHEYDWLDEGRQVRYTGLLAFGALGLASSLHPAFASEPQPPIDTWEVIGEAENRMVVLRNLVPRDEGAQPTRMAREYRFKGVAEHMTAAQTMQKKRSALAKTCRASEPSNYQVGSYEAVFLRFDCPATKKVGRQIIMMTAWVEKNDLQTKEVMFTTEPTDVDVAMAMAFLTSPAAASVPRR